MKTILVLAAIVLLLSAMFAPPMSAFGLVLLWLVLSAK